MSTTTLRIGTRGSRLARWQADYVAEAIRGLGIDVRLVVIPTQGDLTSDPLTTIGSAGLFTKEIQRALLAGDIDIAVHSLKDLPTAPLPGLTLAAVPPRASFHDVLVARDDTTFESLPSGARIGTGSPRRRAQLLALRRDLTVASIRGNVDTRVQQVEGGDYDAVVVAEAGLERLGQTSLISHRFAVARMVPAAGQGALGVEIREGEAALYEMISPLEHPPSRAAVTAERALIAMLSAGCLAPVGAVAEVSDPNSLRLRAVVIAADGTQRLSAERTGPIDEASQLGQLVAEDLLAEGAGPLITANRAS